MLLQVEKKIKTKTTKKTPKEKPEVPGQ